MELSLQLIIFYADNSPVSKKKNNSFVMINYKSLL